MEDGCERLRGCFIMEDGRERLRGFLEAKGSDGDDCEVDERFIDFFREVFGSCKKKCSRFNENIS